MDNSIAEIAAAFSKTVRLPEPGRLQEEPGSAPVIEVPIDERFAAELCFNPVLGSFVLGVTFDASRSTPEAVDLMAEALVLRTAQSRLGSGDVASLDPEGRLSLSTMLDGAPTARDLAERIERSRGILLALADSAAASVQPAEAELVDLNWLRV